MLEERIEPAANVARQAYDRAKTWAEQGDADAAIAAYETAIAVAPDFFEAHSNLGTLYLQNGRLGDALGAYEAAIGVRPDLAPLYCNLAAALMDLERCDEAIEASETAIRLAPDCYEAYANLARAYRRSGRDREALDPGLRATILRPGVAAFASLAAAACALDEYDVAIAANHYVLELDASCVEAYCNLGWLYYARGRYAEAIAACAAAIELRPADMLAHLHLAYALLICGDFKGGCNAYARVWRVQLRPGSDGGFEGVKLWTGESFVGRRLLVTLDERAYTDALQMVRLLPAVKARGGEVVLEVRPELIALFADLPGVDEFALRSQAAGLIDAIDLQVPLLGLPRALGIDLESLPATVPYLRAPLERVERWRPRLRSAARLRVGIVWSGALANADERRRWARLEDVAPLGDVAGIAWFGLQMGYDAECRGNGALTLDPLGPQIEDFADTAAILSQLDLLIAVDTPVVHLAGGLGMPVWTLLAAAPDWRWLRDRDDSPWYPSMRLFRQPAADDWAPVIDAVASELRALLNGSEPLPTTGSTTVVGRNLHQ